MTDDDEIDEPYRCCSDPDPFEYRVEYGNEGIVYHYWRCQECGKRWVEEG